MNAHLQQHIVSLDVFQMEIIQLACYSLISLIMSNT